MEISTVLEGFSSLSQETRLRVFQLLVEYGRDGTTPGNIAEHLKVPDNTLSFHLSHMSNAGLIRSEREGRSLVYFANTGVVEDLIRFLRSNCCVREKESKKRKVCKEGKC
jgi:ArsR family transcriptional regulator